MKDKMKFTRKLSRMLFGSLLALSMAANMTLPALAVSEETPIPAEEEAPSAEGKTARSISLPYCFEYTVRSGDASVDMPSIWIDNVKFSGGTYVNFRLHYSIPYGQSDRYTISINGDGYNYDKTTSGYVDLMFSKNQTLKVWPYIDNKHVNDVDGDMYLITFNESKWDSTPPELEITYDSSAWGNPTEGIPVTVAASDDKGVISIQYKIN